MTYFPLVRRTEISKAFRDFETAMIPGEDIRRLERKHTFQGGQEPIEVYWNPKIDLWYGFMEGGGGEKWFCPLGIGFPRGNSVLQSICQINSPFEGRSKRHEGVFVRDYKNKVYVTHRGKLNITGGGGSRPKFLAYVAQSDRSRIIDLLWNEGKPEQEQAVMIGGIDDPELPYRVKEFVDLTLKFKQSIREARG